MEVPPKKSEYNKKFLHPLFFLSISDHGSEQLNAENISKRRLRKIKRTQMSYDLFVEIKNLVIK